MTSTAESTPVQVKFDPVIPSEKPKKIDGNVVPHSCDYKHSKFYTDQRASQDSAMKKLIATTVTALLFMITEIVGGVISNSLAVLTDAAH